MASSRGPSSLLQDLQLFQETRSFKTLYLTTKKSAVQLEFTVTHCILTEEQSPTTRLEIPWQDVLGAHILDEEGNHFSVPIDPSLLVMDATYVFALFAYPCKQSPGTAVKQRQLREWLFRIPGDRMDTMVRVLTWINYLADPRSQELLTSTNSLEELIPVTRRNRKYLVVINPVGGSGRGIQIYEQKVAPLFEYAYIDVDVQLTDHHQHGITLAKQLPLNTYDCVVAIGGDGSLSEWFNGFMQREDWKQALLQPLGIIPSGSGNGLCTSLMYQLNEQCTATCAAFVITKGIPQPIDLTGVRNPLLGTVMYSFLSIEWALIADVDVDSEYLRLLGGARFSIFFFRHVFLTRTHYSGTIWYLEEVGNTTSGGSSSSEEDTDLMKSKAKVRVPSKRTVTNRSSMVAEPSVAPLQLEDRPPFDLLDRIEEGGFANDGSLARWRKLETGFHIVWAMNMSHAAPDAHVAPTACCNDGYNYIILLETEHPRRDLVNLLLQLEQGTHLENTPNAKCIKTRAYKFIPDRVEDVICVDGEVFKGPIEAQVFHNLARIMSLPS